jgi:uncharacterized membrane protein (UPF0182 family)
LTLWDQRGSKVIRGNVLAIPVEDTLLYVEPIYLQAETAAYPELRSVVLMHRDNLSYAETFDQALEGLLDRDSALARRGEAAPDRPGAPSPPSAVPGLEELIDRAGQAFKDYLAYQGNGRFRQAAEALARLESSLAEMKVLSSGYSPPAGEEEEKTPNRAERPVGENQRGRKK